MIPVVVHGAEGRMGKMLAELMEASDGVFLTGLVTEPGRGLPAGKFHPSLPLLGQDKMAGALPTGVVVVDFSLAPALPGLLAAAEALDASLVVGTTGFDTRQQQALEEFAVGHAVVQAANFSIGVPALRLLLQLLARILPEGFDAEEVETHHVTKLDRPSGTALALAKAFAEVRGGDLPPIHSLRLGGVVGEHTWAFSDAEETLVVTHRAHSRRAFLRGVLPAVRFVATRERGFYNLQDVLMEQGAEGRA
ncbi:4-hydroxy-tetrahydrodipicolinate reductase [bacterium]|nr:4-hydroxy-tetrahydrodipicolinate reductase [bacterium]PIV81370.1 MAG: 4-hydroxy-tetrahydrodipicolinate reductase [bacterium CG17_big_fil_post_rev_8_21_14_2_50_64_8]PJA75484.1 MAG: 4-hydroxy-tetrahydrodipicolinate reductase [bacterium CG_4_9_14_3_um_filter_65_15]